MTPGLSRPGDVPAMRALWTRAFGDGDAVLNPFFSRLYHPEDALVVREQGEVRSMAFLLPATICQGARGWRSAYLYAVATDAGFQKRGYAASLLEYAAQILPARGCKALLLVPGEPSLREYYRKRGFTDFSTIDQFEIEASPVPGRAEPIPPPVYLELREQLLGGRAYVSCPTPVLSFQEKLAGLYRILDGDVEGCAVAATDGNGRALVSELLWPGDRRQGAALAALAAGAARAVVRTPGPGRPFSMVRWLIDPPALDSPYLGIALD